MRRNSDCLSPAGTDSVRSDSMKRWPLRCSGTQRWRQPRDPQRVLKIAAVLSTVLQAVFLLSLMLSTTACGYHEVGHANALPPTIHTIAIPAFASHSQTFRIEQLLTDAVIREFDARTQFKVIHDTRQDADAALKGTGLSATAAPLAYDA